LASGSYAVNNATKLLDEITSILPSNTNLTSSSVQVETTLTGCTIHLFLFGYNRNTTTAAGDFKNVVQNAVQSWVQSSPSMLLSMHVSTILVSGTVVCNSDIACQGRQNSNHDDNQGGNEGN